jgi:hypothetical protein
MKTYQRAAAGLGFMAIVTVASGCAMDIGATTSDVPQGDEAEQVGSVRNAMTAVSCDPTKYDACWEKTDSTGSISTRLYQCKATAATNNNYFIQCPVESDRVLVGGGAEVIGTPSPGGLLYHSFGNANGWYASSKAHYYSGPHQLRVYAIGLKLVNYSVAQLQSAISYGIVPASQQLQHAPISLAYRPAGHITLGGGALAYWNGSGGLNDGQLVYKSYPTPDGAIWIAQSKDHVVSSLGTVSAEIITMPQCPPNLGYCLTSVISSTNGTSGNGYYSISLTNSAADSLLTGVGGNINFQGNGRMFSQLYPFPTASGTAVSTSKDHYYYDTSNDYVYTVSLKRN